MVSRVEDPTHWMYLAMQGAFRESIFDQRGIPVPPCTREIMLVAAMREIVMDTKLTKAEMQDRVKRALTYWEGRLPDEVPSHRDLGSVTATDLLQELIHRLAPEGG